MVVNVGSLKAHHFTSKNTWSQTIKIIFLFSLYLNQLFGRFQWNLGGKTYFSAVELGKVTRSEAPKKLPEAHGLINTCKSGERCFSVNE